MKSAQPSGQVRRGLENRVNRQIEDQEEEELCLGFNLLQGVFLGLSVNLSKVEAPWTVFVPEEGDGDEVERNLDRSSREGNSIDFQYTGSAN